MNFWYIFRGNAENKALDMHNGYKILIKKLRIKTFVDIAVYINYNNFSKEKKG